MAIRSHFLEVYVQTSERYIYASGKGSLYKATVVSGAWEGGNRVAERRDGWQEKTNNTSRRCKFAAY